MKEKNKMFLGAATLAASLVVLVLSLCVLGETKASAYSNELPGQERFRHPQAVWCAGGGWVVRAGCCYGSESCTNMNPCGGKSFSCDGNSWY